MFVHHKQLLVLIILIFFSVSCQDKISDSTLADQQVITPISKDNCDNTIEYEGIVDILDITDSSAKVSWSEDIDTIGYTIFEKTNSGLEVVQHLPAGIVDFTVTGLSEESQYQFIVKTINIDGHYDCNTKRKDFSTTEKQVFISCKEINDYYLGGKASGVYEIDTDLSGAKPAFEVYCDMDNNNGGWTRVFTHNTVGGLFTNDTEAIETNVSYANADKYSILTKLEEFRREGKIQFWLYYPELDGADGGNIWTQLSNPATDLINGYVAIRENYTGHYWGGLEKSTYSGTFIDGSVSHGHWYFAIGANRAWPSSGSIPGPISGITQVQLFVK